MLDMAKSAWGAAALDAARTRVAHVRDAIPPEVLRNLRAHLDRVRGERLAQASTDRERTAIARGEGSDALRLDPTWMDAWRNPSRALREALGDATWVAFPPQVRSVAANHHLVPWHQDVAYQRLLGPRGHVRHVTCFVPLDEDPTRRPTVEFVVGRFAELPHDAAAGFGAGLPDAPSGPHALFELTLGDALVFGDLVPHRSFVPDPRHPERRSLEFRIVRPCDAVAGKDYFDIASGQFTRRSPAMEVA
ncbi:phytanoyl-CoA dioxygenase family protein [Candidatus Binatia bacterium]|nr:phytanoyl-CoA dioxygenase family protein [Candidatus Binatia bacterium]